VLSVLNITKLFLLIFDINKLEHWPHLFLVKHNLCLVSPRAYPLECAVVLYVLNVIKLFYLLHMLEN
jgi:hypothetical protein